MDEKIRQQRIAAGTSLIVARVAIKQFLNAKVCLAEGLGLGLPGRRYGCFPYLVRIQFFCSEPFLGVRICLECSMTRGICLDGACR